MTVSATIAEASFEWTGVETVFACGFQILQLNDATVRFVDEHGVVTTLTRGVEYDASVDGGNLLSITPRPLFPFAPGTVVVQRNSEFSQSVIFAEGEAIPASSHQSLHDAHVLRAQELRRDADKALTLLLDAEAAAAAAAADRAAIAIDRVAVEEDAAAAHADMLAAAAFADAAASVSTEMPRMTTRAGLAALSAALGSAMLIEQGREGLWTWDADVAIATHQADTYQRKYVAANPAAIGAWVRQTEANPIASNRGILRIKNRLVGLQQKTPVVSALAAPSVAGDGWEGILVGGATPKRVYCDGTKYWDLTAGAEITEWWLPAGAVMHLGFEEDQFYFNSAVKAISDLTDHGDGSYSLAYADTGAWWTGDVTIAVEYEFDIDANPAGHIFGWRIDGSNNVRVEVQVSDSSGWTRRYARSVVNPNATSSYTNQANQNTPGQSVIIEGRGRHRAIFSIPTDDYSIAAENGNYTNVGISLNGTLNAPGTFRILRDTATGAPATDIDLKSVTVWPSALTAAEIYRYLKSSARSAPPLHMLGDSFLNFHLIKEQVMLLTTGGYVPYSQDGVGSTTLAQQATRFEAKPEWWGSTLVLVDGALELDGQSAIEALNRMISKLTHDRFLYVQPNPINPIGDSRRTDWINYQETIRAYLGEDHYLETLQDMYDANDGSPNDLADVASGLWPRSLRGDETHLNESVGIPFFAGLIHAGLQSRVWLI